MSTDQDYHLLRDKERSVVYCGNDFAVNSIKVEGPPDELSRIMAMINSDYVSIEALQRHDELNDLATLLLEDRPLVLHVAPPAWPALREIIATLWSMDIADHPVAFCRSSKYSIEIDSPAQELLVQLWKECGADPVLRKARGEKLGEWHDGTGDEDRIIAHVLSFDYYGWPSDVYDAVAQLVDTSKPRFIEAIEAHPELFADVRSDWLFAQHDSRYLTVLDTYAIDWAPGVHQARFWLNELTPIIPDGDPGFAAWPEYKIEMTADTWSIPVNGSMEELLALQGGLLARRSAARSREEDRTHSIMFSQGVPVPTLAAAAHEAHLIEQIERTHVANPLAKAYLIERKHKIAMAAAVGLSTMRVGTAVPDAWDFSIIVSGAQPLPRSTSDEELLAKLNELTWSFAENAPGVVVGRLDKLALSKDYDIYLKSTLPNLTITTVHGESSGVPVLIEMRATRWSRDRFKFDPKRGQEILSLALDNATSRLGWKISEATSDERDRRERAIAFLNGINNTKRLVDFSLIDNEFTLVANIPTSVGVVEMRVMGDATAPKGASQVAALRHAQTHFANQYQEALIAQLTEVAYTEAARIG